MSSFVLHRLLPLLVTLLLCETASAQFSGIHVPDEPVPGSTINIVATWDGRTAADGFDVDLRQAKDLVDVRVLRFGRDAVPVRWTARDGTHRIMMDETRRSPHEIILTIELPETTLPLDWRITPLVVEEDGEISQSIGDEHYGIIPLVSVRENPDDRALDLDGTRPVLLQPDRLPPVSYAHPFEISFWMRSTGLDEILLSTWNGSETMPYPIEVVVGPGGRLSVYRGGEGMHESISSRKPVADGTWHEVRIVFDGRETTLLVDGVKNDSFEAPNTARTNTRSILAIGGRLPGGDTRGTAYSGLIDELVIHADTERDPIRGASSPAHLALTFDANIDENLLARESARPRYAQSHRALTLPPGSMRVQLFGTALQLSWEGSADAGGAFIIERSDDGRHFDSIGSVEIDDNGDAAALFEFVDSHAGTGVRYYRVIHELSDGSRLTSRSVKAGLAPAAQESVELIGNFPNPFTVSTTVAYRLTQSQNVELSVWDLSGQRLATLVSGVVSEGRHEVQFQADDLPSGTYFLRLQTPNRSVSRKMILAK